MSLIERTVTVYQDTDPLRLGMVQSALDQAGVPFSVMNAEVSSVYPVDGMLIRHVQVLEGDAEHAMAVIAGLGFDVPHGPVPPEVWSVPEPESEPVPAAVDVDLPFDREELKRRLEDEFPQPYIGRHRPWLKLTWPGADRPVLIWTGQGEFMAVSTGTDTTVGAACLASVQDTETGCHVRLQLGKPRLPGCLIRAQLVPGLMVSALFLLFGSAVLVRTVQRGTENTGPLLLGLAVVLLGAWIAWHAATDRARAIRADRRLYERLVALLRDWQDCTPS